MRFAAAAGATPQSVSWLQREASGRAWVTSGPGLSHHQRPGCPATRKGTKGTFDVRGPPLGTGTLACTEQQARRTFQPLPHPRRPSDFRNSPRQAQQGLPKGWHPPAWQGHGCSVSEKQRECFSGDFSPPPLSCGARLPRVLKETREC